MSSEETRTRENGPKFTSALMAGALSGLTVDLLFYPIDTIKTRLQSSSGFLASGGFKGVYRGLGSVAVGSAPGAATFFVTYESMKPTLLKNLPDFFGGDGMGKHGLHMVASSIGEVVACLIRVPTEVIKSRQQTSTYGTSVSSAEAFKAVFRESGIRGYYRGYGGTVGREIPFTCIQFPLYEHLKRQISTSTYFGHEPISSTIDFLGSSSLIEKERRRKVRELPTWQAGLAGSVAGAVAAGLTTPLDVVKTRIMLERRTILPDPIASPTETTTKTTLSSTTTTIKESIAKPKGVNHRMVPTLLHIIRTEPLRNLFAGFIPRTLWIGFGGAVFLGTFDKGVKILEEGRVL